MNLYVYFVLRVVIIDWGLVEMEEEKGKMGQEEKYVFYERFCKHCPRIHICIDENICSTPTIKRSFRKKYNEGVRI